VEELDELVVEVVLLLVVVVVVVAVYGETKIPTV
jgi:Sec-independent protein translocase protein TatA